jgi:hypothetical protein
MNVVYAKPAINAAVSRMRRRRILALPEAQVTLTASGMFGAIA